MTVSQISTFAALAFAMVLAGCEPAGVGTLDEEKNPLFVEATSRRNAGDVPGAIQLFERTLQANPVNASAHLELGLLYERPENDYASAIYHFQRFLQLRPASDRAEIVKEHILTCKQELAKSVLPASLPQTAERELMALSRKNEDLRREMELIRAQYTNALLALTNQAIRTSQTPSGIGRALITPEPRQAPSRAGQGRDSDSPTQAAVRQHIVARNDTFSSIARRYAVSVEGLRAANPGVNERRLQVGKPLRIPIR